MDRFVKVWVNGSFPTLWYWYMGHTEDGYPILQDYSGRQRIHRGSEELIPVEETKWN